MTHPAKACPDIESLIRSTGALLEGHFLLSSGLHSNRYVQCARLLENPVEAESVGRSLADILRQDGVAADLVVSPALGGILVGYEVARALELPFMFTERAEGAMVLRRGFAIRPGSRVAVAEDVITTGKSTREVMEVVRAQGGRPVAALAIVERGADEAALGVPLRSLMKLAIESWPAALCPLCREGKPVVKPGSRPRP